MWSAIVDRGSHRLAHLFAVGLSSWVIGDGQVQKSHSNLTNQPRDMQARDDSWRPHPRHSTTQSFLRRPTGHSRLSCTDLRAQPSRVLFTVIYYYILWSIRCIPYSKLRNELERGVGALYLAIFRPALNVHIGGMGFRGQGCLARRDVDSSSRSPLSVGSLALAHRSCEKGG